MDTGDPVQSNAAQKQQGGGKGNKKKKTKKISLDEFLATDAGSAPAAPPGKSNNWAVMTENAEDEYENNYKFDRSTLPTAPKAAMGPAVDLSQIPPGGPFSAYIGNLSYDANEEDLQRLFTKLEIDTVRIITDGGRPRGYAYVDFLTKESLVEALSYNDREYMGRMIRVDLATDKNREGRGGLGGGRDPNEPDRTEGDWRRKDPSDTPTTNSFGSRDESDSRGGRYGDRDRDRGYGFGGDRDRERRGFGDRDRGFGGDRDRGFGGDRDRGFGGDRSRDFGDRDRGFGGRDRGFGDRDRGFGGDRDRGFGGDRDRGFGGDRSRDFGDRDRGRDFGDRDRGRDFGDRDRGRDFGDRDRGGGRYGSRGGYEDRGGRRDDFGRQNRQDDFERKPRSRDGSRDGDKDGDRDGEHRSEGPKERPVLKLQPRSKPAEEKENKTSESGQRAASIFGSAKPVDTYAKEKEIEEKLKKKEVERDDIRRRDDDSSIRRRDDDSSKPRRIGEREDIPAPLSQSSRTSEESSTSEGPRSPTSPKSADLQQPKMVPAPPPKENAWSRKREAGAPTSPGGDSQENSNDNSSFERTGPRRDERQKPPAGRGGQSSQPSDRRPGPRTNGGGSDDPAKPRHAKEKQLPKSIDDMPKMEENRAKDFSTANKFSFLMEDENDVGDKNGSDENEERAATAHS